MTPPPTAYSCARLTSPSSIERSLGGGPAHVERDRVRRCRAGAPAPCTPTTPAAGPEFDDVHRLLDGGLDGGQAAVRLHQQERRAEPVSTARATSAVEVSLDDRPDIGVDDRRRGPLVLLDLRQHLRAEAQGELRRHCAGDLLDELLVRRVGVGVNETDRDRLDPFSTQQQVDRALDIRFGQRYRSTWPTR